MWCHLPRAVRRSVPGPKRGLSTSTSAIVEIKNGTFYKNHPSTVRDVEQNSDLFPGLTFSIQNIHDEQGYPQNWAVVSQSSRARTTFLRVLAGQMIAVPATSRTYPLLTKLSIPLAQGIRFVGFDADRVGVRPAHASARYESRRETTEPSLRSWLLGRTTPAALAEEAEGLAITDGTLAADLEDAAAALNLGPLLDLPVNRLSNGQTRRARIAQALVGRPRVLLLDAPFTGLDPRSALSLMNVLGDMAKRGPRIVVSLGPDDAIPDWVSHVVSVGIDSKVLAVGPKPGLPVMPEKQISSNLRPSRLSRDGLPEYPPTRLPGEVIVDMRGVMVTYSGRTVLGSGSKSQPNGTDVDRNTAGIWWRVSRGERWGVFGANGSGKTTLLSLVTSDHPQAYGQQIQLFGRSRLPSPGSPGISVFELQKRIGHASPEIHALFPRRLSVRRTLQSAWSDAPLAPPRLTPEARLRVDACLRWFADELAPSSVIAAAASSTDVVNGLVTEGKIDAAKQAFDTLVAGGDDTRWADNVLFGELSVSQQRLLLFLRALVARPDIVILDEALSGMDASMRDRALLFLTHGESVAKVNHSPNGSTLECSTLAKLDRVVLHGLSAQQALLVVAHRPADLPGLVNHWICLPDGNVGGAVRSGRLAGPLELHPRAWDEIWGAECEWPAECGVNANKVVAASGS